MTRRTELEIAREVASRLLADHDAIADATAVAVGEEIAAYSQSEQSRGVLTDLREHCDAQIRTFLSSFLENASTTSLDFAFAEDAVTRRVRQGIPVVAVIHAFRVGHQVVWQSILRQAAEIDGGRTAAALMVEPLILYANAMSTLVANVYVREQGRALTARDRLRRDVLELLLSDPAGGLQAARSAGIELDPTARYSILAATVGSEDALQALEDAISSICAGELALVVTRHQGIIALLRGEAADAAARVTAWIRANPDNRASAATFGISLPAHSVGELGRAHGQAVVALELASEDRPVVALSDVPVTDYLVANADLTARTMIPEPVRRLALSQRASDRALLQTLHAYTATGLNVQQTAAILPAHPNTVHNRLRRLAETTGYDIHDTEQLMRLSIELRLAATS